MKEEILMETRLQKWGNSSGIRIPKSFLKTLNLNTNDEVNISMEEDKIIISKINKKSISLKNRIKKYTGPNLSKDFKWDDNRGREIW